MSGIKPLHPDRVRKGLQCPYCGRDSQVVLRRVIYGRPYGNPKSKVRICWPCKAYVGCHGTSGRAKGRLANKALRNAKIEAHQAFDPLWNRHKGMSRSDAYHWLAREMHLPKEHCHIGMFDIEQCKQVVELCNNYMLTLKALEANGNVE